MSTTPGTSSNPFEILGLDRSASFDDVKAAYRRLARQYHPDANPGDPTALERFTTLRRAYDRLKIFYQTLDQVEAAPASGSGPLRTPVAGTPGSLRPPGSGTSESLADRIVARVAATAPRDVMAEPGLAGTGSHQSGDLGSGVAVRRAFRRTGSLRQSEALAPEAAPPARTGERLPPPLQIESGHRAARAELIYGQRAVVAGDDPQMFYAL